MSQTMQIQFLMEEVDIHMWTVVQVVFFHSSQGFGKATHYPHYCLLLWRLWADYWKGQVMQESNAINGRCWHGMVKWHEGMTWYGGMAQCKSSLRAVFHMSHVVIVAKSTCAKMLTWHDDVAWGSNLVWWRGRSEWHRTRQVKPKGCISHVPCGYCS